jgi:hypothetical protein
MFACPYTSRHLSFLRHIDCPIERVAVAQDSCTLVMSFKKHQWPCISMSLQMQRHNKKLKVAQQWVHSQPYDSDPQSNNPSHSSRIAITHCHDTQSLHQLPTVHVDMHTKICPEFQAKNYSGSESLSHYWTQEQDSVTMLEETLVQAIKIILDSQSFRGTSLIGHLW